MRLRRVDIANFRSIKNVTVDFDTPCRVLVGINETGKSNVLRALALLDPQRAIAEDDVREFPEGEELDQDSYVRFVFTLDDEELDPVHEGLSKRLFTDKPGMNVIEIGGKHLSLRQFCAYQREVTYRVDIRSEERAWQYWTWKQGGALPPHLMKPKASEAQTGVQTPQGASATLGSFDLVDVRGREADFADTLEPATAEYLADLVGDAIATAADENHPPCIFWEFEEDQLLPGKIVTAQFASSPEICPPLKSMFALAGVVGVTDEIARARARPNGMANLLKRVARQTTKHFHEVWKEYRDVRFHLAENGTHIDAAIEDVQNNYNVTRRSDGFKKFISFLLLISARERTKSLVNVLYLHDEPEASLHPSGARYMREELIRLSDSNMVVYSTHSTFMIDRSVIRRHYIVRKENEITTIAEADESNIQEEEVLFQALGTSVFEGLKDWNVIFEGWRDHHLFEVATTRWPVGMVEVSKRFAAIGTCYSNGAPGVDRVTPMLLLARKECVIVTDGDDAAKRAQESHAKSGGHGKWVRYDELVAGKGLVTGEDFVVPTAWPEALATARRLWPNLPRIEPADLSGGGRLGIVNERCEKEGIPKEERKRLLEVVKEALFKNLKRSHVEEFYYEALAELARYLPPIVKG